MPFTNTLPIRRLGLVHGLLAGTNEGSPLALAFYLATLLMVGWATYLRFFSSKPPRRSDTRREPAIREPDREVPPWPMPHTTSKGFSDSRFLPEMRREKSQATQPKEVKSSP